MYVLWLHSYHCKFIKCLDLICVLCWQLTLVILPYVKIINTIIMPSVYSHCSANLPLLKGLTYVYLKCLYVQSIFLPSVYSQSDTALCLQSVDFCPLFTTSLLLPSVYSQFIFAPCIQSVYYCPLFTIRFFYRQLISGLCLQSV